MLEPLMIQMIKFISLVIVKSNTLAELTADDHKKTKEIIQLLIVLYSFQPKNTLYLLVELSKADPQLVVKLMAQKMLAAHRYQERVDLLRAISQIIDQFRRITFDEETLKSSLERQHKLVITNVSLTIKFQGEDHNLFDLLKELGNFESV